MLDVEDYRLGEGSLGTLEFKRAPRRRKSKATRRIKYLGAGIPGEWLSIAGNLPGKALHVGLAIWLAHGIEKQDRFRFTPRWYEWFELSPGTLRRCLHRLKEAGLIRVEHRPGCSPIVTLLAAPKERKS
jgi:hypothetical protein